MIHRSIENSEASFCPLIGHEGKGSSREIMMKKKKKKKKCWRITHPHLPTSHRFIVVFPPTWWRTTAKNNTSADRQKSRELVWLNEPTHVFLLRRWSCLVPFTETFVFSFPTSNISLSPRLNEHKLYIVYAYIVPYSQRDTNMLLLCAPFFIPVLLVS